MVATGSEAGEVDVSIIIANYNARALLEGCLRSIYRYPPTVSFEVIVVDDASPDTSAAMVRELFPQVRLLVQPVNSGYARSNNWAIRESRGRYVHLLNSDTEFLPGVIDILVEFLDSHPQAGAAGNLLFNGDGTVQASVKSPPAFRSAIFGARSSIAKKFPNNPWTRKELLHWKSEGEEPFQAGYVSSASMMIPRAVAREVGDLDTRLWYFIDADYCKRIWNTGRPVYYIPRAKAIHFDHHGGTKASLRKRFQSLWRFHYGAFIYFRKHSGKPLWHPAYLVVLLGLGLRFAISLVLQGIKEISFGEGRVYDRKRGTPPPRKDS
jgi:GT2 family glycosyltransferase